MNVIGALPLLVVVAAIAFTAWRYLTARAIAEQWLMLHRYRVRSLRVGWFSFGRFAPRLFRNEKRAFEFRAEVDDMQLGGTGVVWLRVWTDWIGMSEREPEVSWERMPARGDDRSRTLDERLEEGLLALLGRVEGGESIFRPRSGAADDGGPFDEEVEHLLALSRRGLVSCDTPVAALRGPSQYAAVTNVALTDRGRRYLAERRGGR